MGSQHDEREGREPAAPSPDAHPGNGPGPVRYQPDPRFGQFTLRERYAADLPWPLAGVHDGPDEAAVSRNLEQVGVILRRLDLDKRDIVRLRTETRAILDGLAA